MTSTNYRPASLSVQQVVVGKYRVASMETLDSVSGRAGRGLFQSSEVRCDLLPSNCAPKPIYHGLPYIGRSLTSEKGVGGAGGKTQEVGREDSSQFI